MRQSCRKVSNRVAYVIDDRHHIGTRLPLMHIKDRLVALKAELVEQRDRQSKHLLHRFLMITPHRHDAVGPIEQPLCQLALYLPGRISAMLILRVLHRQPDN